MIFVTKTSDHTGQRGSIFVCVYLLNWMLCVFVCVYIYIYIYDCTLPRNLAL